ncbi:MAG: hypothetical protein IKS97_05395 [Fibrobacter sp.]|nr:hypothetical protein [Fibrobacter sp.]
MNCSKILATVAIASLFAASSYAADEVKYGAITIKKVTVKDCEHPEWNNPNCPRDFDVEKTVAFIDDESKETPVITKNIEVDSVFFNRKFKKNAYATLMLPVQAEASSPWKLGVEIYRFIEVAKTCPTCDFAVYYGSEHAGKIEANTPYVVLSKDNENHQIAFSARNTSGKIILNTTTNDKVTSYIVDENVDQAYKFSFTGTYESIEFKNKKGIYGFAGVDVAGAKIGDFVQASCDGNQCASIRPFRAYLKATLAKASLNKSASDEDVEFPETISVYLVDSDKKGTTYIGQMNTSTGEIVKEDNRWFDMKGRVLDHKPTAKGTYYNNKKKVIIK